MIRSLRKQRDQDLEELPSIATDQNKVIWKNNYTQNERNSKNCSQPMIGMN